MGTVVGIWIDHDDAVLVKLVDGATHLTRLQARSRSASHDRLTAFAMDADSFGSAARSRTEEARRNQLHKFYKRIIHDVGDADRIFILGPDEARIELKKEMRKDKALFTRIAGVERAGRMTEEQIVAKVEAFFHVGELRGFDA